MAMTMMMMAMAVMVTMMIAWPLFDELARVSMKSTRMDLMVLTGGPRRGCHTAGLIPVARSHDGTDHPTGQKLKHLLDSGGCGGGVEEEGGVVSGARRATLCGGGVERGVGRRRGG